MRDKVILGAAVLDAVGRSCVLQSDSCTLQSQITLCKKNRLPPIYEMLSSTHQLDFNVKITPIGLKWLTVTLSINVQRFRCKFQEHLWLKRNIGPGRMIA